LSLDHRAKEVAASFDLTQARDDMRL